ncbi:ABC transporter substrate-binding protein [Ideonella sp. A 288]|uniref:ABC transporter substrate-binding protein n=1 Tax=Ideonella sp. A 288 TaxID=1962181 RepID=UPI000B4BBDD2|nr:ABC transporter substrate-binding protein [Ideonella sp. A 288]
MLAMVLAGLSAWPAPVAAQDDAIVIGASLPLSGPNGGVGQEALSVINAYFDSVNKAGGIGGRRLKLQALDDEFNAQKAVENATRLADGKAVALFNCWGTSNCAAMMPVITRVGLPMVAGISGAGPMREKPGRYAFNVRATTEAEITRMVQHLTTIGQTSVALVYQNDPFGKSGRYAAQAVFDKAQISPAAELSIERDGSNAEAVVESLKKLPGLGGVILVAAPPATVKLIPMARERRVSVQFYNLAAQANRKVAADLGPHTAGVVFTTLVPNPWRDGIPVVHDYQKLLATTDDKREFSYLGLEVYINARVLVDGLRKAGRTVQRDSLVTALETMGLRKYGPVTVDYAQGERKGSRYVGLTMIDRTGRFVE